MLLTIILGLSIYVMGAVALYLLPPFFPKVENFIHQHIDLKPDVLALIWPLILAFELVALPFVYPFRWLGQLRSRIVNDLARKRDEKARAEREARWAKEQADQERVRQAQEERDRQFPEEADRRRRQAHADKWL